MPRVRLLRLLLLPFVLYLALIALWVALPSIPNVHGGNNGHYHQDVLRAGKQLTTAHESRNIYRSPRNDDNHERSWFAVDWQLIKDSERGSIILRIGEDAEINLTSLAGATAPYVDATEAGLVTVTAKSGDLDGVMMPWFSQADACLLNWEIDHGPKIIDVRALVVEPGVIQIWPESTRWVSSHADTTYKSGPPADDPQANEPFTVPSPYSDFKPFLTISNVPTQGDQTDLSQIEVGDMTWYVPTKTFTIRKSLLHILKPITLSLAPAIEVFVYWPVFYLLAFLIWGTSFLVWGSLVGGVVTIFCWLAAGRPAYEPWARKFLLTRWLYKPLKRRAIWGPGGLITYIDEEDEGSPKCHEPAQTDRIGTLETPLDFFRSRAPLDDLLNTFERTRWMTTPLRNSRAQSRNRFNLDEETTIHITQDGKVQSSNYAG